MNLYLISQEENDDYDTYDSCVVAAKTEDDARVINPGSCPWGGRFSGWCSDPKFVTVKLIGKAIKGTEAGIILESFNAG